MPFFLELQNLLCFYFKGNPAVRNIKQYRRTLTAGLANLLYLDDRPVFEVDRLAANAWKEGGVEAEREARRAFLKKKEEKLRRNVAINNALEEEGKRKQKLRLEILKAEARKEKEALLKRRDELKAQLDVGGMEEEEKRRAQDRLKRIEDDLS